MFMTHNQVVAGSSPLASLAGTARFKSSKAPTAPRPLLEGATSNTNLLKAATARDRNGLTRVGRQFQKHGSRPESNLPRATGNPDSINSQGLAALNEILSNQSATRVIRHHARFGEILDIRVPGGTGARFTSDGKTFLHFLD